jgi:signal transduction histidine kinase
MLDSMHGSTLRLQDSIEEILQFASTGISSSNQVSTVMLNLATIVEEVVESQRLSARRRGVEFVFDQSWRAMAVQVDKVRMRRVFNNLISNAVKYANPSTPVELSAEKVNNMFVVRIKNYGIGIPKQDMAHIFDGFYRGSNVIKNEINGTGMGLFMSRSIIEQHKGHITIESVENESTTVQVTLPAAIETRVS